MTSSSTSQIVNFGTQKNHNTMTGTTCEHKTPHSLFLGTRKCRLLDAWNKLKQETQQQRENNGDHLSVVDIEPNNSGVYCPHATKTQHSSPISPLPTVQHLDNEQRLLEVEMSHQHNNMVVSYARSKEEPLLIPSEVHLHHQQQQQAWSSQSFQAPSSTSISSSSQSHLHHERRNSSDSIPPKFLFKSSARAHTQPHRDQQQQGSPTTTDEQHVDQQHYQQQQHYQKPRPIQRIYHHYHTPTSTTTTTTTTAPRLYQHSRNDEEQERSQYASNHMIVANSSTTTTTSQSYGSSRGYAVGEYEVVDEENMMINSSLSSSTSSSTSPSSRSSTPHSSSSSPIRYNREFLFEETIQPSSASNRITKYRKREKKNKRFNHGRWTKEEHELFVKAFRICGRDWSRISREYVTTRMRSQVASHAQKYLMKLEFEESRSNKGDDIDMYE